MIGHGLVASSLLTTGNIAQSRAHYDRAIALYDPAEHRPLAMLFGQDVGVAILCSSGRWLFGFLAIPMPRLRTQTSCLKDAREIGQAATLIPCA